VPTVNEPQHLRAVEYHEIPAEIIDDLRSTRQHPNLARGIVWADILADIAADDERRRQLPDAA
jgi:hypothetical protein